jgi:predicted enzyme related to lactoylglutathione lyase
MSKQTFKGGRDVIIQVQDLERALKFYGETLGLPVSQRYEHCTGFEAGGFQLFVEKGESPGPVFEFLVSDVAAAKQKLLAAGCTVVEEDERVPRLYMRDPYGLTFNVGPSR